MIVMQYRFTLPADYDMAIIEQRIANNGAKLDGFPGLLFKTWLLSRREEDHATENRYAPLYVWHNAQAMARFLHGAGFKKLTADFGWPEIETWLTLRVPDVTVVKNAAWLSLEKTPILPHQDLASLPLNSQLCAWDVSRWQLLQVDVGDAPVAGRENYRIGYVATGEN